MRRYGYSAGSICTDMDCINFSHNWNNKLDCRAFTTLRLFDPENHRSGRVLFVRGKDKDYGAHEIKDVRVITLDRVNEFIAYLDTGYCAAETQKLIKTMYKNKNIDWATQKLALILLVKVDSKDAE